MLTRILGRRRACFNAGAGGGNRETPACRDRSTPHCARSSISDEKVSAEYLGLGVGRQRRGLRLIPQPVANAGFGAAGAPAALIDRGARRSHGFQPRQADIRLIARHAPTTPKSTTMRTPSMVSDVSAIDVASTTLRLTFGAGAMARSCAPTRQAHRTASTISIPGVMDALAKKIFGSPGLRAAPGKNAQHRPGVDA